MKHFRVEGEFLKKAPSTLYLYHQKRTLEELNKNSVVFNTYPTGAGKTRASLLYIKENINKDVLFIAPTNELLRQHSEDIKDFVNENKLPHIVVKIDANVVEKLRENHRKGSTLYELISNPLQFKKELLIEDNGYEGKRPIVIIVNPDIFYYCFYSLYNPLDKGNLMEIIIRKFGYIIIDEFHYYNSKQLANFLFFMLLSKAFGYFENGRKICILTATPDKMVEEYLRRGKIEYSIISKENESKESEDYEKLKTLSELDLYVTNKSLDEVISEMYAENNFNKDSVVISQSIYIVNKLKEQLIAKGIANENIGVITGAIKSDERKKAVKKPLILATPTVDIGYNFKKENKLNQNIDEVITEANTSDQALQRIGRAGRILGKKIQNNRSKVVLCVNDSIYDTFNEVGKEISRNELKNIIQKAMPERNIMKKYIESNGILELCFPIQDIYRKIPYRLRQDIENIFNMVVQVFAPKINYSFKAMIFKISNYKKQCAFISEYNKSTDKRDVIENLNNEMFIDFYKNYYEFENEELIDGSILEDFSQEDVNAIKVDAREELVNYFNTEIAKIKCLMNFRGTDISKAALVFDKYYKFAQENRIFVYDIFHLIRYYDIEWYEDKQSWESAAEIKLSNYEMEFNKVDNIDTFIIVNGIRENPIEITWEYGFYKEQDEFEEKYISRVEAINNIVLVGYEYIKGARQKIFLPEKITNAFKEKFIPIFTISQNPKEEYKLRKIIKNQPIFLQKLKVMFSESEKEYYIIIGTNSVIVDSQIAKVRSEVIKEDFFIF